MAVGLFLWSPFKRRPLQEGFLTEREDSKVRGLGCTGTEAKGWEVQPAGKAGL